MLWLTASCSSIKKVRGSYKSIEVDVKTKYGGKIEVDILDYIDRVVGPATRDIANYCGLVVRTTVSFAETDGNWRNVSAKYGEIMWLKVKVIMFNYIVYIIRFNYNFKPNITLYNHVRKSLRHLTLVKK